MGATALIDSSTVVRGGVLLSLFCFVVLCVGLFRGLFPFPLEIDGANQRKRQKRKRWENNTNTMYKQQQTKKESKDMWGWVGNVRWMVMGERDRRDGTSSWSKEISNRDLKNVTINHPRLIRHGRNEHIKIMLYDDTSRHACVSIKMAHGGK